MVEEEGIRPLIEAIGEIEREQLERAFDRIDLLGPVLRHQMVFDDVEGRGEAHLFELQEQAVHPEGDLIAELREVGAIEARAVADDEAAPLAGVLPAQLP